MNLKDECNLNLNLNEHDPDPEHEQSELILNKPQLSPDQLVVFNWASPASVLLVAYQISILYVLLGL